MADLKIADLQVYNGTTWQEFTDTDSAITTAYKCRNNILYLENKTDLSEEDLQNQINELKAQVGKKILVCDLGNIGTLDQNNSLNVIIEGENFVKYESFLEKDDIKVLLFSINDGNTFNNLEHKIVLICYGENPSTYHAEGWGNVIWLELNKQTSMGGPTFIKYIFTIYLSSKQGPSASIKIQGVPFDVSKDINNLATTVDNLAKATPTDIKGDNGNSGDINTFHLKLIHDNQEITPQNPVLINMPKTFLIDNDTKVSVELNAGVDFPSGEGGAKVFCDIIIIPLGSDEGSIVAGPKITFTFSKTGNIVSNEEIPYEIAIKKYDENDPYNIIYRFDVTLAWKKYAGIPEDPEDILEKITIEGTFDYPLFVEIRSNKMSNEAINS